MNKLIFFIVAVIILTGCGAQKNSASLKYEPIDTVKKITVKKILIVGAGSSVSRIFLENLSDDMIGVLKDAHVIGNFKFLENLKPESHIDMAFVDSLEYDAYIVFSPIDKASFQLNQARKFHLPLWNAYVYGLSSNSYRQTFALSTYVKTNTLSLVWETSFIADFDPTDKEKYKFITNDILGTLYIHYFSSK
jgi:hypothetical protein